MLVVKNSTVFWNVISCNLLLARSAYSSNLKMEAESSAETSVSMTGVCSTQQDMHTKY
jgi:hypothetical protein